jgi:hypothetical protein
MTTLHISCFACYLLYLQEEKLPKKISSQKEPTEGPQSRPDPCTLGSHMALRVLTPHGNVTTAVENLFAADSEVRVLEPALDCTP